MKKLILALIASAAAMSAAHAEGPYIGVGIASADHSYSIAGATNGSGDGYKASGKLFGGFDLDKTWGVEAGYTDFRKTGYNYTIGTVPGHVDSDGHSFYVAGKGTVPLNEQFSLFGKLGVSQNKTSLSGSINTSDSKTEMYGALGAQFNLNKQVALTLEYERYGKDKDFGQKANVWTAGARYSF
ncbi:MAG: porin family protein [Pseudomonadota bacterium]